MKKIIALFPICLLLAMPLLPGQIPEDGPLRERLESMKVAFITEKLALSPEQSQAFWPVYNEYQDEREALRRKARPNRSLAQMSDGDIKAMLAQQLETEAKLLDLRRTYFDRLQEVITIRQVALLQQAERDFNKQVVERLLEMRRRRNNRGGRG